MPQPADMNSPKTAVHELFLPISAQIAMFQDIDEAHPGLRDFTLCK